MEGKHKLSTPLVVHDVEVVKKTQIVEIPKMVDVEKKQIKWVTEEEVQTRYKTEEEITTKYIPEEKETTVYKVKTEDTVKYVSKEVECEKPVSKEVEYERPVIIEKKYEVISADDKEALERLKETVPVLLQSLDELEKKIKAITLYKLVEKEVPAPRIKWVDREIERIIWKEVERDIVT